MNTTGPEHEVDGEIAKKARQRKRDKAGRERACATKAAVSEARHAEELFTQKALAKEFGTSQSQLSKFEKGYPNVISREKLLDLRRVLEPEYSEIFSQEKPPSRVRRQLAFCGNWECPAAVLYVIDGQILVRPRFLERDASDPGRCEFCDDEELLSHCGHCGSELHVGVRCHQCGEVFVVVDFSVTQASLEDLQRICRERNERNRLVLSVAAVEG